MTHSNCVFLSSTSSIRNSSINKRIKEETERERGREGLLYLLSSLSLCFFSSIQRLHLLLLHNQFKREFIWEQYNKRITMIIKKKNKERTTILSFHSFRFFFFCKISVKFLFTLHCQLYRYK